MKAFRDTWRDGIHSYLTYLRDRLVVARDLLAESGSLFVQIGDENVHRVRALMRRPQFLDFFEPLIEAGLFAPEKNPAPVQADKEGRYRIPWRTRRRAVRFIDC